MSKKRPFMRSLSKHVDDEDKNLNSYTGDKHRSSVIEFYKLLENSKVFIGIYIAMYLIVGFGIYYLSSHALTMDLSDIFNGGDVKFTDISFIEVMTRAWPVFAIYTLAAIIFFAKYYVNFKMSFGTLKDRTEKEVESDARWSSRKEIDAAYKKIPDRETPYPGKGGPPIARDGNNLYIDDSATNFLVIGTSRSGKGEEHVLPSIEIYSRAEHQPSMVISDPKMELAPACLKMLKDRGYEVHILNLIDPEWSMYYNPLEAIIEEEKAGHKEQATELLKSLCENVIPKDPAEKDPFFPEQAKKLLYAAIKADISDNLNADIELNHRLENEHKNRCKKEKNEAINKLEPEKARLFRILDTVEEILSYEPDLEIVGIRYSLMEEKLPWIDKQYIARLSDEELEEYIDQPKPAINYTEKPFEPVHENEKKIHLNSIIRMVKGLSGMPDKQYGTALDKYFMSRPAEDEARLFYSGISTAGQNAKGDILATFSGKTDIFISENIGRMMSKNSLNFLDVGFGKKPIAVFLALPDYNKANWFIATVFINQLYTTLSRYATAMPGGKTNREVVFLLDEFGNLPPIDNIEPIVSVSLGRGFRFHFIIQGFAQLEDKYGKEGRTIIMDNCGVMKYILSTNEETKKTVSELIGKHHVSRFNRSGRLLSISKEQTEMVEEVPLITPEKLGKLLIGETIVMRALNRTDKHGNPQFANPIKNFGEYKMKFRYQYLSDLVPSGQLLYRSEALNRILENNPEIRGGKDIKDMKLLDIPINNTQNVNIQSVQRSPDKWLKIEKLKNTTIATFVEQSDKNNAIMDRIFELTNYPEELRDKVVSGEDEAYNFTIGKYLRYANILTQYPKWEQKGYEILDYLEPCNYDEYLSQDDDYDFYDFE